MKRIDIPYDKLILPVCRTWEQDWLLLTAGDLPAGAFNPMTVAWGGFGVMWSRPLAMVVVRPTRHTYRFMEQYDTFTLCAFHEEHRDKLEYCGNHSGRNGDKVKACGLTPIPSRSIKAPGYAEADLIVECRKVYFDDLEPSRFLASTIAPNYPAKDYHRIYFGEIVAVSGTTDYMQKG